MRKGLLLGLISMTAMAAAACSGGADDSGDSVDTNDGQAVTATTGGAEDSYVSTSYPTTIRGARTDLKVGATSAATQQTYLKFTVSGIPAGATNVKATLKVYANTTSTDAVEAHLANSSSWSESTLVLSNAPGEQATVLAKTAGTTQGAWSSFDVSAGVAGNGTVSFVLSVPAGGAIVDFASKEAGAATAPSLTVTYSAPAVATTLFGAGYNPHTDAYFSTLSTAFGGMKAVRDYDNGSGITPYLKTYQAEDVAHNVASSFSFKYLPSEVLAGQHDAEIKSFFQGIQDGHPVYWTYWHEPDDEIFKTHTFTATDYRNAWAHIRAIADGVKATRPNLKIFATLIIMEYSMTANVAPSRPLTGSNGMYPGDNVIDVFGVDAYNGAADKGQVVDVATQFKPVIDFAQQHGKPWAIGEIGSCPVAGNPNGRATYLSNALSYWKSRQYTPVFVTYFNVDWPVCDYRMENDPAASKVWKTAMTTGYASF